MSESIHGYSRPSLLVLLGLQALVLAGCVDALRQPLQGSVTLDGRPLEAGYIRFRPEPGSSSPTAGGAITAGTFSIDRNGGPMAGRFRVEITASRPVGRTTIDIETGERVQDLEQYLPPRYNSKSELEVEVTPGGDNTFQFDLRSE
jgi:hypothetical protein